MYNRSKGSWLIVAMLTIVSVVVFNGCPMSSDSDSDPAVERDDGTVTLSLSNAESAPVDSWFVAFVFERGSDPNTVDGLVAVNYSEISGGAVSDLVLKEPVNEWEPSGDNWTATGGRLYDLYTYTTNDEWLDYNTTSKLTLEYPETFSVDGDFAQSYNYETDLVDAPTLTVEISGADMNPVIGDEPEFTGAVLNSENVMLAAYWEDIGPDPDYESSVVPKIYHGDDIFEGTWLYEPGETYLVMYIVGPNPIDNGPETPDSYTLITEATLSSGHQTLTKVFGDDPTVTGNFSIEYDLDTWYGPYTAAD